MKASELRIGNYVSYDCATGGYWQEKQVCASNFGITAAGTLLCESYKPIPITEDWLIKFGFEENKKYSTPQYWLQIDKLDDEFLYDIKDKKFYLSHSYDSGSFGIEILYVHQLQNLYFALTGEELTLK